MTDAIDALVTKCEACGFRMHAAERSCLNCKLLADWQEEKLKAYIAAKLRHNMRKARQAGGAA